MAVHPITGMHIEDGHGALPVHHQARLHCDQIEASGDKPLADKFRNALGIPTAEETADRLRQQAEMDEKARDLVPTVQRLQDGLAQVTADHATTAGTIGGLQDRATALETNHAYHAEQLDALLKRVDLLEATVSDLANQKKDELTDGD